MLPFHEALARLLALTPRLPAESLPLERCLRRYLREELLALAPLPPFAHSSMDGYAVRAAELESLPRALPVRGESRTGGALPEPLEVGCCMRIFTGAPMPEGADSVVMQEHVEREGDLARFSRPARAGQCVRREGEDLAVGALALPQGARLGPAQLALAASLDRASLSVGARPRVALVSTGDELRDPGSPPRPGSIPDSNSVALSALVEELGGEVVARERVEDEREATRAALERALAAADLVLTVGGVSVGEHDHVRGALEAAGVRLDTWRVRIKPGKPLAFGTSARGLVLGLPGNPASAMVTFLLFGAPVLRAMQGAATPAPAPRRFPLAAQARHEVGRLEFARCVLEEGPDGQTLARLLGAQASGSVPSMAWADGLAWLDAEREHFEAGSLVPVTELRRG